MTRPFCAICTAYLSDGEIASRGVVHEPIGRDGSMVVVCERCASEEAEVINAPLHEQSSETGTMLRTPHRVTANRERLKEAGLCRNGERHGPATHGRLCDECSRKAREYQAAYRHTAEARERGRRNQAAWRRRQRAAGSVAA